MDTQWLDQHARMVDIGGRQLNAVAAGDGVPAVVFEGGLGSGIGTWAGLVQRAAALTSVVAYARANIGRSDPAPPGRTSRDSIADLHALLAVLGTAPPYVVVGHSWGGALALQFAADHPEETAGLVLIDPVHHDGSDRVRAQLPPEAVAKSLRVARGENLDRLNPELLDRLTSEAFLRGATFPDVPTILISHGGPQPELPNMLIPVDERERMFHEGQRDYASRLPGGRHVIAEPSGHHVQREHPELVFGAIEEVVARARR